MPSLFKVTTENHSHTIRTSRSKVAASRSYITNDLIFKGGLGFTNWRVCVAKPLSEISKSQTWEFVFNKFKIEESIEFELHVVVLVSST